jgi:hypothetical protein
VTDLEGNMIELQSRDRPQAIRPCQPADSEAIYRIINDAAQAYRGVIPADRWKEPYMPREELEHEIQEGVLVDPGATDRDFGGAGQRPLVFLPGMRTSALPHLKRKPIVDC